MPERAIGATVGQCPFVATTMAIGWVRRLLNALVWIIAAVYIAIDTDEMFQMQDILLVSSFALYFLLASFQSGYLRYLGMIEAKHLISRCNRCATLMFLAACLDIADSCTDQFIEQFQAHLTAAPTATCFAIGWMISTLATVLAALSMSKFLRIVEQAWRFSSHQQLPVESTTR